MQIKDGKLLYHLTTIDCFESIVQYGLLSRNALIKAQLEFTDTANHEILLGRDRLGLESFIPFHFHIHTRYDTYVKDNNKDKEFIYLCLKRSFAQQNNFSVLPLHPTSTEQPNIYPYTEGIEHIDWDTMELKKTDDLPIGITERYRNQVRMAECLSPDPIQIECFNSIIVKNAENKFFVAKTLRQNNKAFNPPYININPKYF